MDETLDLSAYVEKECFHFGDSPMMATRYAAGCVLVEGSKSRFTLQKVSCAMVPHQNGIRFYLHKLSAEGKTKSKCFPHLVEEIIAELGKLKCDPVLTWRLLATSIQHKVQVFVFSRRNLKSGLVRYFEIVSKFRSALLQLVNEVNVNPPLKKLFGDKKDLKIVELTILR
jgi:hypothetical protein